MKLTKFLAITILAISSLFIATYSYSQTIEQYKQTIITLRTQLENSNKTIDDLNNQIKADGVEIKSKNATIANQSQALAENTNTIKFLKDQISSDQIEITNLRNDLDKSNKLIKNVKYTSLGFGATYPVGGQIIYNVDIPFLPIGFYADIGLIFPNQTPAFFAGGGIRIRF